MATKNVGLNDFLEAQGLEKYAGKFERNGARNMQDLDDFDIEILTDDIGMSKLEAKRFLRNVNEMFGRKVRYVCDGHLYLQKAWDHAEVHARVRTKRDVRIDLLGCDQEVQVSYSRHLVCPLTLALFVDPVITPEGETYEKAAILEHLRSGTNYDPFSYKELKEEELRVNKAVLSFVKIYQDEIEKGGEL